MTVGRFCLWEILELQLPVAILLPLILFWIIYFSFYFFTSQQQAVNEVRTAAKRLPALQAIQVGASVDGVSEAPVSGQM